MLSPNRYLHLVFDFDHDFHYTDTLLTLDTEAYLWYTMRCRYQYDAAIFASETNGGICLRVFDNGSQYVLKPQQNGLFNLFASRSPEPCRVQPKTFRLQELGTSEEGLLGWLLERTEAKELKNKRVALVFSLETFETVYHASRERDKQRLLKRESHPDGHSILVLRISPRPGNLEKIFLAEDAILPQISDEVRKALDGPREPLLDALKRQMRGQLDFFYQIDDAFNMLVYYAVAEDAWEDTLQALRDQADYLQFICNCYGCTAVKPEDSSAIPPRHREIAEQLRSTEFRETLRVQTAQLRNRYPSLPILEAMKREELLPEDYQETPMMPEYDDSLARNIRSLCLPENFLAIPEYRHWQDTLVQIKSNFRTIWNYPRIQAVCSAAGSFYKEICGSAGRDEWETLNDALQLLQFCGEHICDKAEQESTLSWILENGMIVLDLSHNIFQRNVLLLPTQPSESLYSDGLNLERKVSRQATEEKRKMELLQLETLHGALYAAIDEYNRREISNDEIDRIYRDWEQRMKRMTDGSKENSCLRNSGAGGESIQAPAADDLQPDSDEPSRQQDRYTCEQFIKRLGL